MYIVSYSYLLIAESI